MTTQAQTEARLRAALAFPAPPTPPQKAWTWDGLRNEYRGLTNEALSAYKAAWTAYEEAVRTWRRACAEVAARAAQQLTEQGFPAAARRWTRTTGGRGRLGRWRTVALKDALAEFAPGDPLEGARLDVDREEEWLRNQRARDRERQEREEARALRDRAIAWLLKRGRVYGRDFTAETAAQVALDEVAAEIKLRQAGRWNGFTGQNCEGPCRGWDGVSRRCDCGNRRVTWVVEGTFEQPVVYGEAY